LATWGFWLNSPAQDVLQYGISHSSDYRSGPSSAA
jgi:hypothetical protein